MSHIVQIQTQVRDPVAVEAACRRLGLLPPVRGKARLFTSEAVGLIVRLPAWNFPVVFDTATGEVKYDNYNGAWGDSVELSKFLQMYATEKAKLAARQQGHTVTEQQLADGTIKLTVQIGGSSVKLIEITVSPTGETTVQTKGFNGSSCRDASRFIEHALGQAVRETLTSEFHQAAITGQSIQAGQR